MCGVWGDPPPLPDGTLPGPWEAGPAAGEGYEKYSDPRGVTPGGGTPPVGRWRRQRDDGTRARPRIRARRGTEGGRGLSAAHHHHCLWAQGGRPSGWAGMPGPGLGRCQVPTGTSRVAFAPTRSGDGGKVRALVRDPGGGGAGVGGRGWGLFGRGTSEVGGGLCLDKVRWRRMVLRMWRVYTDRR